MKGDVEVTYLCLVFIESLRIEGVHERL